jgi:hypothetical protein
MKSFLVLAAVASVLVIAGCDPFGADETVAYVTGVIYTDASHTAGAEGVTVYAEGDSSFTYAVTDLTDADGVFMIEMQVYPVAGEEGGYTLPPTAAMGLEAYNGGFSYVYADIETDPLVVEIGDTLRVWDIDLTMLGGGTN